MKKLILLIYIFILCSTVIKAQELVGGELIFDFEDDPEEWDLQVKIEAFGTVWDGEHEITES